VLAISVAWQSPERAMPLAILTCVSGLAGVIGRDNRLTSQVRTHEERVLAELPVIAELLALAVAAGEGPVAALERVVRRSNGALSQELGRVLGDIRTGQPVASAFDDYSARTGLPVVARFADGIAVAVERGTPLAEVLHAQAGDVREARRRALIESGARREIAMMVPVVFLVLPTTIIFAFWPGVIGLRMVTS
jgi:tight adherence protein C